MEIEKLKAQDIATFTADKAKETEIDIRKELQALKMDIYGDKKQSTGKRNALKKNLARVLTRKSEIVRANVKN